MKYCNVCKLNVEEQQTNCPLCGSHLSTSVDQPFEKYDQACQPYVKYPHAGIQQNVDFFNTKTNRLILLGMIICVIIELMITHTFKWSAYVLAGGLITMFSIITPITHKFKVYVQLLIGFPLVTAMSIFMELVATNYISAEITVRWILPSIYIASLVMLDFFIALKIKKDTGGYFSILLFCTAFIVLYRVVLFFIPSMRAIPPTLATIAFLIALLNFGIVTICCFHTLKDEYTRKWNV
ncbi:MAG: DUF6320 domain-containing protein [Clostridia bacterium]|nr:DUF6320 domain-containing protein [Clostridia bacterium]